MTPITKPVTRLSNALVRDRGLRPLVVTVEGTVLTLRAKGLRSSEVLDLTSLYYMAVKARLLREKAERRKQKKLRKGA